MTHLLCLLGRHKPDYATIQTEDNAYTADCRWCDQEIVKRRHSSWRKLKTDAAKHIAIVRNNTRSS